jgi:hypothetical protein
MTTASSLKIFVLYRAARGREATFHDIDKHLDAMDEVDYSPRGFMEMGGGISIVLDNYLTLFRSTDFKMALDVVYFLAQSVSWLNGQHYDVTPAYAGQAVQHTLSGDMIRLEKAGADNIAISYERVNTRIPLTTRGSMFFNDVQVSKQAWLAAAVIALTEYQRMLDWVAEEGNAEDNATAFLTELSKGIDAVLANS